MAGPGRQVFRLNTEPDSPRTMRRAALPLLLGIASAADARAAGPTTFCNPLNIDYRFSQVKPSHREAADPTMVVHNGMRTGPASPAPSPRPCGRLMGVLMAAPPPPPVPPPSVPRGACAHSRGHHLRRTRAAAPRHHACRVNLHTRTRMGTPRARRTHCAGTYWLFASKSGGYWHSTDMNDWTLVVPTGLPLEDYAPMVVVLGGKFYYTAFNSRAIYSTGDPHGGKWSQVASMQAYGDPGMLVDDDARVYMYSGCGSNGTIRAVQLDSTTWQEVGAAMDTVKPDPGRRGFEVSGDNNENTTRAPYVEGAFMNKINGRYYLQYAVPGTQFKSYADGLFVGDAPLGPFQFQAHSPLSSRLVGFAAGAGHGSTYAVPGGGSHGGGGGGISYYHISTSTISVRDRFERRLVIYPLITSNPALLWVDSYLGDYPHALPHAQAAPPSVAAARTSAPGGLHAGAAPLWMLLSLNKSAAASSGTDAALAFNEDIRTWWSAATGRAGEWLAVNLGGRYTVNAVQVNFADESCTIVGTRPDAVDAYKYYVEYCTDSDTGSPTACVDWKVVDALDRRANTRDLPHDYVELPSPLAGVTKMRITNKHMPGGAKFSLSGLRVFGLGAGSTPAAVAASAVKVVRDATDPRHATVSWPAAQGAEFYVIRFGIAAKAAAAAATAATAQPYTMVHNVQVYGATAAELHSLVVGEDYKFVVDTVNSNGVTYGEG